jgi:hypothetical protein
MIDNYAESLHHEEQWRIAVLIPCQAYPGHHREHSSLVMRLAVSIGRDSTRRWFPMLRACSSNEHELSNGLLKRHSWAAIEAVNVPARAMVEAVAPRGPTHLVAATRNQNKKSQR